METYEIRDTSAGDFVELSWIDDEQHRQWLIEHTQAGHGGNFDLLGVWMNGELVAYGGIDYGMYPDKGTLRALTVRQDLRGQGIGTILVAGMEERVASRGLDEVVLHVEITNPGAKRLYERLGYIVTGTGQEHWSQDSPDGQSHMYHAEIEIMNKSLGSN